MEALTHNVTHLLQCGSETLAVSDVWQPMDQSHLLGHLIGHICQGVRFHWQTNTELALEAMTKSGKVQS